MALTPSLHIYRYLGLSLILCFTAWAMWPALFYGGAPQDEGLLLVYPELLLRGWVPNRDFESLYPPGNLWRLSMIYKIFGVSVWVERLVGMADRLAIIAGVFVIASWWGVGLAFVCSGISAALLISFASLAAYSWFGALACGLWGFVLLRRSTGDASGRVVAAFLGGALTGFSCLHRIELTAGAYAALALAWQHIGPKRALVGGLIIPGLALLFHVSCVGVYELFDALVIDPGIRISPGRRLPLPPTNHAEATYLAVLIGCGVLVAFAAFNAWRRRTESLYGLWCGIAVWSVLLLVQAVQRADTMHMTYAACVLAAAAPLALFQVLSAWSVTSRGATVVTILTTLLAVFQFTRYAPSVVYTPLVREIARAHGAPFDVFFVGHEGRTFPVGSSDEAVYYTGALREATRRATSSSRLFVGPSDLRRTNTGDTFIYHLLPNYTPASYFLEMNPGTANAPSSRLPKEVGRADLLILNRHWNGWSEANRSAVYGDERANHVVHEAFMPAGTFGPLTVAVPRSK